MAYPTYVITGNACWAAVQKPNTTFDPQWKIDVCNLDKAAKAVLAEADATKNIKKENKDDPQYDRGEYVTIKQKCTAAKGEIVFDPPKVTDKDGQPFEGLIGNGSKVAVKFAARPVVVQGRPITCLDLREVRVLDLVEYAGSDSMNASVPDLDSLPVAS